MAEYTPSRVQSSNFPWVIGTGVVGSICAGLTYLLTHSPALAALFSAIVVLSLLLGWVAASWFRDTSAPPVVERRSQARLNVSDGDGLISSNAMRFARRAIEATPTPVIILDQNSIVIMTNQAARTRFVLDNKRARFATIIRRPDLLAAVERVLATREPVTIALETKVPVDRYERASIAVFDVSGTPFVMLSLTDETEVRMSERMRADFLANASHELRTPLTAIIGFIETLRGPARDDEPARARFLEVMHNQADRMSRLISDLLSLSRIELNEHVAPTSVSDLAVAAQDAINGLQPSQSKRIEAIISAYPIWVLGDRDEMTQVIINLIDNALKYGDPNHQIRVRLDGNLAREAAVTLASRQWDEAARLSLTHPDIERDRNYAVVRVENAGVGIERQFLPRLAERFFRVEDSASGTSGTGLGLAIVKHIVSRHRGGLTVESEPGRGAAFGVYLPVPRPDEIEA